MNTVTVISVIKESSTVSISVGAIKLSVDMDNIENLLDNVFNVLKVYDVMDEANDLPMAKKLFPILTEVFQCEYLKQVMEFDSETGSLRITHSEIIGWNFEIYKYVAIIKDMMEANDAKYAAERAKRDAEHEAEMQQAAHEAYLKERYITQPFLRDEIEEE